MQSCCPAKTLTHFLGASFFVLCSCLWTPFFLAACALKQAEAADPATLLKGTILDDDKGTVSLVSLYVLLRLAPGPALDQSGDVACVKLAATVGTLWRPLEVVER